MVAVVDGCPYTRVRAGCKRDCRSGAAYLAWKAIIRSQQDQASDLSSVFDVLLLQYECDFSVLPCMISPCVQAQCRDVKLRALSSFAVAVCFLPTSLSHCTSR